jgi:hypothetical protein
VIAQIQAETMQPRLVWESVTRTKDPARRVNLMLAAADGLLGRLHEPPWLGIPKTPGH